MKITLKKLKLIYSDYRSKHKQWSFFGFCDYAGLGKLELVALSKQCELGNVVALEMLSFLENVKQEFNTLLMEMMVYQDKHSLIKGGYVNYKALEFVAKQLNVSFDTLFSGGSGGRSAKPTLELSENKSGVRLLAHK